ncbi:MAG: hypothetical protein ACLR1T_09735 [Evtepia gabavorous]
METDARMLAELQEMLSSNSSRHSFRQYLIRSNMLTQEMETLLAGSPSTAAHYHSFSICSPFSVSSAPSWSCWQATSTTTQAAFSQNSAGSSAPYFRPFRRHFRPWSKGARLPQSRRPSLPVQGTGILPHPLVQLRGDPEDTRALLLCRFACAERAGLISCSH